MHAHLTEPPLLCQPTPDQAYNHTCRELTEGQPEEGDLTVYIPEDKDEVATEVELVPAAVLDDLWVMGLLARIA